MKFLLLNQTFHPDVASSGQHLADVAEGLAQRGHAVTVVTGRRAYDDPHRVFAKEEWWHGVRILRVTTVGFGKDAKWRRILDLVGFLVFCGWRMAFLSRPDVVVSLTSPPLISLLGLCLARLRKSWFVYWVMDLNPDEAIAAKWIRADSLAARVLEWISRLSLRHADQLIVLDHFMLDRIVSKGLDSSRVSIIPPWSHDPEVCFDRAGRDAFRQRFGLASKFVVMYSGNHSPCHPLDTVLEAARILAKREDIVFCFVGGGIEFRRIQTMVRSKRVQGEQSNSADARANILCVPYQPRSTLSASLSAADLQLVVMGEPFVGIVHPCKIYNVVRTGAPLIYIGPVPSPATEILAYADNGLRSVSLRHDDVEGLVRQIVQFTTDPMASGAKRSVSPQVAGQFSKQLLLPRFIERLEVRTNSSSEKQLLHGDDVLGSARSC